MATSSGGDRRKKRLVSSLEGDVLERLSMKLNPRMLLKDYQSLAGRLKYTYEYIRNFARERDPTLALLQHWWSSKKGREKTVSVLIELLSDMERDDVVDLLRPHEFYHSHEAAEYDETMQDRPVIPGSVDMNSNPYSSYFYAMGNDRHQETGNFRLQNAGVNQHHYNGPQFSSNQREHDVHQGTALQHRTVHPWLPSAQKDIPEELNKRMFNMKLDMSAHYYENIPAAMPSTSSCFPAGSYPHSASSSLDSLQFERQFLEKDPFPQRPATNAAVPSADVLQLDRYDQHQFYPMAYDDSSRTVDEFYGARRDPRSREVCGRPRNLDGSSAVSSEMDGVAIRQKYPGMGNRMGGNPGYMNGFEQYMKGSVDAGYWPQDHRAYGCSAPAQGHSMTVATDKVALVIGNQDYVEPKLRELQYPEQDAADMASALTELNFKVISLINLTLEEMRTAMLAFCCLLGLRNPHSMAGMSSG